ncbi:MAG: hypothetical protein AB7K35_11755 [Pseudorhodoplanes sp.]
MRRLHKFVCAGIHVLMKDRQAGGGWPGLRAAMTQSGTFTGKSNSLKKPGRILGRAFGMRADLAAILAKAV